MNLKFICSLNWKEEEKSLAIEKGHGQFFSNGESASFFITLEGMCPFIIEK